MKSVNVVVKSKTALRVNTADREISKASILTLGVTAGLVGLWSLGAFVSALITIGPVNLVSGFFQALGM